MSFWSILMSFIETCLVYANKEAFVRLLKYNGLNWNDIYKDPEKRNSLHLLFWFLHVCICCFIFIYIYTCTFQYGKYLLTMYTLLLLCYCYYGLMTNGFIYTCSLQQQQRKWGKLWCFVYNRQEKNMNLN